MPKSPTLAFRQCKNNSDAHTGKWGGRPPEKCRLLQTRLIFQSAIEFLSSDAAMLILSEDFCSKRSEKFEWIKLPGVN